MEKEILTPGQKAVIDAYLADYLATKGYSAYASDLDGNYGWILKTKQKTL